MEDSTDPPEGRLLRIYPAEDAEDKTSVDIIAIHGLGTTTPRTWEYRTQTGVVNWLSDFNMLPQIVPSARIYTFSWNANYSKNAPVTRITNVAEVLLSNLEHTRNKDDTHPRPLIFVASCFGGLILTKVLEIANIHESTYRKILVATSGVVFLACPLQGTRAGNAAQWHAMISGILGRHPSKTLLEDLDGSRKSLSRTTHLFANMIQKPPMRMMTTYFWESQPSQVLKAVLPGWLRKTGPKALKGTKMIVRDPSGPQFRTRVVDADGAQLVEEDSATITGYEKCPLDAPHSMMNKFHGPSDANFGLVSSSIKKMVEAAFEIALSQQEAHRLHNKQFMVSRRPNPLFTGREGELKKLKQALCPSPLTSGHATSPKIYVIHGMGGAGKSEVAVKFAHENRPTFWGIFWVDARSKSSITNGFAAIARLCGHQDESLEGMMMWLQNSPQSWLLILDNADNRDVDMARFLPAGRNGSILITTRLTECAKHQTVGKDHYERLNQETAIDLLIKACDIEGSARSVHEDQARAIVELLGCYALAVIQAGAAISQGLCSLEQYRDIFRVQRRDLFECFPEQARSEYVGVYATFEVTAKYLEDRDDQIAKDALHLLSFYAFMHFSDFPYEAFEEAWKNSMDEYVVTSNLLPDDEEDIRDLAPWHVSHLPTFMQNIMPDSNLDKLRIYKAISLLASFSLVTFDSTKGMTRMHPVTHFWSKDRLRKPELSTNARLNGFAVLSLSIGDPYTKDPSPLSRQLQSHIESLAYSLNEWGDPVHNFHFQQCVYRLSWVLYPLGNDSALFELLRMIPLKEDGTWMRTENGQRIQWLHGISMRLYGDAKEAVLVLERLSKIRSETLGADDPKALDSLQALAAAYLDIEDTANAIALMEQISRTRNETLSPGNGKRLASLHELARAYLEIEETTEAINWLEEMVNIETIKLRPEHTERLTSQHELARAYLNANETDKAIVLFEEVVDIKTRTLRPEHTERLKSQHELARAYLEANETDKAIVLFEKVVDIRTRTLRPEHNERLSSQYELARAYLEINKTDKAIALLEPVVEIEARTLRKNHPDRVSSVYVLAQCHYYAQNDEKALELARSIEGVAQNRGRARVADWNAELIGWILEKINIEEDQEEEEEDEDENVEEA